MKRLMMAAASVCALVAGPAIAAPTFLSVSGVLTSSVFQGPGNNYGNITPINSPVDISVTFDTNFPYGNTSSSFLGSFIITSPLLGGSGRTVTSPITVVLASNEYQLFGAGIAQSGYSEGFSIDLKLAQPVPTSPGPLSLANGSSVSVSITNGTLYGTIGSASTAVPEPASWAMMIAGTALVGVALRRRRPARVTFATA